MKRDRIIDIGRICCGKLRSAKVVEIRYRVVYLTVSSLLYIEETHKLN